MAGLVLLQVPPPVALESVVVKPTQTLAVPLIAAGKGLTVIGVVTKQPVGNVKVMVAIPAATPVTVPVVAPTEAIPELLLVHVDVPEGSVSVVELPTHTVGVPDIADGNGLTVTGVVAIQPVGSVYVIVSVPADTPVTIPDAAPTVAKPLLAVQVPPGDVSPNVVVKPIQTLVTPVIAAGSGLTVIGLVTKQPPGNVYVMVAVPAVTPVTSPVEMTVAFPELLVQVPPAGVLPSEVIEPTHTLAIPVIAVGTGFTVTGAVIIQPVGNV